MNICSEIDRWIEELKDGIVVIYIYSLQYSKHQTITFMISIFIYDTTTTSTITTTTTTSIVYPSGALVKGTLVTYRVSDWRF